MGQSTSIFGPISVVGQNPTLGPSATPYVGGPAAVPDSNPDLAPSLIWGGIGIRDPRWLPRIGAGALVAGGYANQDAGWYMSAGGLVVCDQVPAQLQSNNIAAAQGVTSGTAMTLAAASTGITVLASALSLLIPIGATIPAGALVIDGNTAYQGGGSSNGFKFFNPTAGVARAVRVTAAADATGGAIVVNGYDIYGQPMTESITAVASTTVSGKKAFKYIVSIVPGVTDAGHNYSVGTSDIFGLNVRADFFAYTRIVWDNTVIIANTGFVAAVTTDPATATTGDVRGTYATQSASDGTKRLQMFVAPSVATMVASSLANAQVGLIGVEQYSP